MQNKNPKCILFIQTTNKENVFIAFKQKITKSKKKTKIKNFLNLNCKMKKRHTCFSWEISLDNRQIFASDVENNWLALWRNDRAQFFIEIRHFEAKCSGRLSNSFAFGWNTCCVRRRLFFEHTQRLHWAWRFLLSERHIEVNRFNVVVLHVLTEIWFGRWVWRWWSFLWFNFLAAFTFLVFSSFRRLFNGLELVGFGRQIKAGFGHWRFFCCFTLLSLRAVFVPENRLKILFLFIVRRTESPIVIGVVATSLFCWLRRYKEIHFLYR